MPATLQRVLRCEERRAFADMHFERRAPTGVARRAAAGARDCTTLVHACSAPAAARLRLRPVPSRWSSSSSCISSSSARHLAGRRQRAVHALSYGSVQPPVCGELGGLIQPAVVDTWRGSARIRQLTTDEDLLPVADLQAGAFHEPLPLGGALDALALTMLKAEVLDGLKKKALALNADGFAVLVAEPWPERCVSDHEQLAEAEKPSAVQVQQQQQQQQQRQRQQQPSWQVSGTQGGSSRGALLGVVEVGLQEDVDVLQALRHVSSRGDGPYAYVTSMAVAPELRRCGLGAALLRAAELQAARWGATHVVLHVHEGNAAATALYDACGLRCVARDPSWRGLLPGGRVRLLMAKPLFGGGAGAPDQTSERDSPRSQQAAALAISAPAALLPGCAGAT